MTAGRVHPKADKTVAECANCDWTVESTKPGEAAHQLMDHNTEEHAGDAMEHGRPQEVHEPD